MKANKNLHAEIRRVPLETSASGIIYRTFDCAKCGAKIYQVVESAWEKDGKRYHADCVNQTEASSNVNGGKPITGI